MPIHDEIIDHKILEILSNLVKRYRTKSILDLACGWGWFAYKIRTSIPFEGYMVGLDIYEPYLRRIQRYQIYDDLVVCDCRFLPFRKKSFDVVIAMEIIEHLKKEEGCKLIRVIENLARRAVILSTPNKFYPQSEELVKSNPFEAHRSSWSLTDFKNLGYNVITVGVPVIFKRRWYSRVLRRVNDLIALLLPPRLADKLKHEIIAYKILK